MQSFDLCVESIIENRCRSNALNGENKKGSIGYVDFDGNFFRIFGRLHPTKNFPYISLLVLCGLGLVFSLFMKLSQVITAILAMRIVVQFIGQAVGVVLLRDRVGTKDLPFRMWLFPVPVILSIAVWVFLFLSTGWFALWGSLIAAVGIIVYGITKDLKREDTKPELKSENDDR